MELEFAMLLLIYLIACLSLLISLYALLTLKEARDIGKTWVTVCRNLSNKVDQLEKKRR